VNNLDKQASVREDEKIIIAAPATTKNERMG
jgi:hypothetical protein